MVKVERLRVERKSNIDKNEAHEQMHTILAYSAISNALNLCCFLPFISPVSTNRLRCTKNTLGGYYQWLSNIFRWFRQITFFSKEGKCQSRKNATLINQWPHFNDVLVDNIKIDWVRNEAKNVQMATVLQSDRIAEKPLLLISINLFYFDAKKMCLPNIQMLWTERIAGRFSK